MSNRKKREALPRDLEIRGAEIFGKHLSPEKQRALLIVTLTACALPMILGVRMWDRIPEIVETGLIGPGGQDDSLPRWAVALLLPGLMCLLEAVAQFMLLQYQKRMKIPPAFNRLMGRWGFPTISLLFCSGAILETSGQGLSLNFYTPCILGLVLMLLGFRSLRRENRWFRSCFVLTLLRAVHFFLLLLLNTTIWVSAGVLSALLVPLKWASLLLLLDCGDFLGSGSVCPV